MSSLQLFSNQCGRTQVSLFLKTQTKRALTNTFWFHDWKMMKKNDIRIHSLVVTLEIKLHQISFRTTNTAGIEMMQASKTKRLQPQLPPPTSLVIKVIPIIAGISLSPSLLYTYIYFSRRYIISIFTDFKVL